MLLDVQKQNFFISSGVSAGDGIIYLLCKVILSKEN